MTAVKNTFLITLLLFLIGACENENAKENPKENAQSQEQEPTTKSTDNASSNTTYLCKINGQDWAYTEASGIVSRHPETGKRTAKITFKKKLEKGSESVQLTYDGDSFQLESAALHLKFPKKGGGRVSGIYQLFADTRELNPESEMSGTIDLSNATTASGNAELIKFNISYEKDQLENAEDATITVSGIEFSGIGYSDISKLFNE